MNKHAFSGGRETLEEHRELGGQPEIDVPYQYLSFFLPDDAKLQHLHDEYQAGRLLSGEMKRELIEFIVPMIENFQRSRSHVTDEVVRAFMTPRRLLP